MTQRKGEAMQEDYIQRIVKNLPVLRAATGLTQSQLGSKLGVSRQTIVAIENKKNSLTWSLYLAIICVFQQYEETGSLIENLNLFSPKYITEDL